MKIQPPQTETRPVMDPQLPDAAGTDTGADAGGAGGATGAAAARNSAFPAPLRLGPQQPLQQQQKTGKSPGRKRARFAEQHEEVFPDPAVYWDEGRQQDALDAQYTFYREPTPTPTPTPPDSDRAVEDESYARHCGAKGGGADGTLSDATAVGLASPSFFYHSRANEEKKRTYIMGVEPWVFWLGVAVVALVLAAALGLGLGMGLKNAHLEVQQAGPGAALSAAEASVALAASTSAGAASSLATSMSTAATVTFSPTTTATPSTSVISSAIEPAVSGSYVPAASSPPDAVRECRETNNTNYIVINLSDPSTHGAVSSEKMFVRSCGIDYSGIGGATEIGNILTGSMQECIEWCAGRKGCTGCGWGAVDKESSTQPPHRCWLKSELGKPHEAPDGWFFAVLRFHPDLDRRAQSF